MEIVRTATVAWEGGLRDGQGAVTTPSGALESYPYGFSSRFEGVTGTNPEELLAAAHAACFTMSLTLGLEKVGYRADRLHTKVTVTLVAADGAYSIPVVKLRLDALVPGLADEELRQIAAVAEANCPVSKLFNARIELEFATDEPLPTALSTL